MRLKACPKSALCSSSSLIGGGRILPRSAESTLSIKFSVFESAEHSFLQALSHCTAVSALPTTMDYLTNMTKVYVYNVEE